MPAPGAKGERPYADHREGIVYRYRTVERTSGGCRIRQAPFVAMVEGCCRSRPA
jgi:hypothetical protein